MTGNIEQHCYLPNHIFYLLDSSSTSTNHILVELFENWNFHTEIGSNLYIVKKDNRDFKKDCLKRTALPNYHMLNKQALPVQNSVS